MCGIAGIAGRGWNSTQLESMISIQRHRGPDATGIYTSPDDFVGLGHNRLSIIDLSAAGNQPMANRDGTSWVVFNGEIYNYLELRDELSEYPYRSHTDTEVILAAYERWGESCVKHFVGMFAFALWDERREALFCARDRLGIKPFHYAWDKGCFLFGSEIKAIVAAGLPAEPNLRAWADYLVHGLYDHGTETFFAKIHSLAPGHTLKLEKGREVIRCYWDLPALSRETTALSDDEAAERFLDLLRDSVRLRLRSDVPLGVNASGGLDSASLMVMVDDLVPDRGELKTFTAVYGDPNYDEGVFATQVPGRHHWSRHLQRLEQGAVWDLASEALFHQEAPFGGISTLAYHHLHRLARASGVTVLLEGQGVDEMMAGYAYFRPHYYLDLVQERRWKDLRRELAERDSDRERDLDSVRRLATEGRLGLYQDGTSFLEVECLSPELRALAGTPPRFPQPFADHLRNALYVNLRYTKLPRVLRMNDRLSMAFSRELREPYLDHRIVEFLFRVPSHQKIRLGRSKYLLRHAMAGRLPDGLRLAEKRSVVTPQREWLRNDLRSQIREIIDSPSFTARGLFDVAKVRALYKRFCQGEGDNAFYVWQWANTELWWRMFIDQPLTVL